MMRPLAALALVAAAVPVFAGDDGRVALREGWTVQSSAKVPAKGDAISTAGFATTGWHKARVPNTVVARPVCPVRHGKSKSRPY